MHGVLYHREAKVAERCNMLKYLTVVGMHFTHKPPEQHAERRMMRLNVHAKPS